MIAAAIPPQKAPPAPYEPYKLDLADPITLRERVDTGYGHRQFEAIYYTGRNAHQVITLAAGRFHVCQLPGQVLELYPGVRPEAKPRLAQADKWIAVCASEPGVVQALTTLELIERFHIVAPDAVPLSAANNGAAASDAPPPSLNLEGRAFPVQQRRQGQDEWHVGIVRGGTVTGLVAIQVDDFMQLSPSLNAGWCATALAAAMNADDAPRRGMRSRVREALLRQVPDSPPTEVIANPTFKPTSGDPVETPDEPWDDRAEPASPEEVAAYLAEQQATQEPEHEPEAPDAGERGEDDDKLAEGE